MLSFGRLRQRIVLKCVPHVQHDYFSSFNQSDHCFSALSLPLPSSFLKLCTVTEASVKRFCKRSATFAVSVTSKLNGSIFRCLCLGELIPHYFFVPKIYLEAERKDPHSQIRCPGIEDGDIFLWGQSLMTIMNLLGKNNVTMVCVLEASSGQWNELLK